MSKPTKTEDPLCVMLRRVIEAFTDHHKDLILTVEDLGRVQNIELQSHVEEQGKIIGTKGHTLNALKFITKLFGERNAVKAELSLVSSQKFEGPRAPFIKNDHWKSDAVVKLLREICEQIFFLPVTVTAKDGKDTTVLTVALTHTEPMAELAKKIEEALGVIFTAIAKATGRNAILIDVVRSAKTL